MKIRKLAPLPLLRTISFYVIGQGPRPRGFFCTLMVKVRDIHMVYALADHDGKKVVLSQIFVDR